MGNASVYLNFNFNALFYQCNFFEVVLLIIKYSVNESFTFLLKIKIALRYVVSDKTTPNLSALLFLLIQIYLVNLTINFVHFTNFRFSGIVSK